VVTVYKPACGVAAFCKKLRTRGKCGGGLAIPNLTLLEFSRVLDAHEAAGSALLVPLVDLRTQQARQRNNAIRREPCATPNPPAATGCIRPQTPGNTQRKAARSTLPSRRGRARGRTGERGCRRPRLRRASSGRAPTRCSGSFTQAARTKRKVSE
jgi:hypothetical protein